MGDFSNLSRKARVLLAMGHADPGVMIDNLETKLTTLPTAAGDIPVTRNDGRTPTCYVCCPSIAYIDYALSELRHFNGSPALSIGLHALVNVARPVLWASGIDRHVQLNNWLLATNPPSGLAPGELEQITKALVAEHPGHALVWRSLNDHTDAALLGEYAAAGYDLYPARQIYLFDCRGDAPKAHRDELRDRALLVDDYQVVKPDGIGAGDYARIAQLYGFLYLEKYTQLNPQYSEAFIQAAHEGKLMSFYGLRRDGQLDGVVGFFDMNDVMTAPIVGYDTTLPKQLGLYRRLMAIGIRRARQRRVLFNMSAGAAGFKRNRGGVAAIEYAAVYTRHLGAGRRAASWIVRSVLDKVGPALLTRFEL
jgi:hypothetical protein